MALLQIEDLRHPLVGQLVAPGDAGFDQHILIQTKGENSVKKNRDAVLFRLLDFQRGDFSGRRHVFLPRSARRLFAFFLFFFRLSRRRADQSQRFAHTAFDGVDHLRILQQVPFDVFTTLP